MVDRHAGGTVRLMEEADLRDRVGILTGREVWGGEVMDGLKRQEEDFEVDTVFDSKPVELV